ncbi:hypothetical protein TVAG_554930 [Trichomonas vaginalis G3]|uniref:Uncharacterized protein n=1 Tax=Trichomonas vaginalis (strain ATCC PRA-98 / G3) TaxID=412133 RepID=A2H2A6_TRIV3|nr:hypothetical protein TVAGG3_0794390 [Trichomonas vaginalis G3]XP_001291425.2 hypothetical protein TVAGG3_0796460 [Trichomonas vaginalis G3]EAX76461.1 hypothetical protein TVAG_554930 [Trichomonas vaginalis G3]KAI5496055.1 hypothetical protein TVAGG3_0794390 [Trichomonas vaginalis G3]KAI5496203.1 hypothetical protein TVAGG3_0796460 [Trichomonas vaginalis G3]|eukprot:XP_001289391.1 hypothetical protein [Trichomonas vaginalis G3]
MAYIPERFVQFNQMLVSDPGKRYSKPELDRLFKEWIEDYSGDEWLTIEFARAWNCYRRVLDVDPRLTYRGWDVVFTFQDWYEYQK